MEWRPAAARHRQGAAPRCRWPCDWRTPYINRPDDLAFQHFVMSKPEFFPFYEFKTQLFLYGSINSHVRRSAVGQHVYPNTPDLFFSDHIPPRQVDIQDIDQFNFRINDAHSPCFGFSILNIQPGWAELCKPKQAIALSQYPFTY
jgi:hypothetical protein